jgi:CO dehydrogenase/acetyl-CoA synthase alpha subunit
MTDETRARFLAGIAAQVPAERVAEVHLFGAIRQGGQESGVAVVAVHREEPPVEDATTAEAVPAGTVEEAQHELEIVTDENSTDEPILDEPEDSADTRPTRYTVYTARFRHTLKGPERGKWELAVTEEADAPLLTVDAVVRGVSRRSGETDETIRLSGDEFRAALPEPARA